MPQIYVGSWFVSVRSDAQVALPLDRKTKGSSVVSQLRGCALAPHPRAGTLREGTRLSCASVWAQCLRVRSLMTTPMTKRSMPEVIHRRPVTWREARPHPRSDAAFPDDDDDGVTKQEFVVGPFATVLVDEEHDDEVEPDTIKLGRRVI